MSGSDSLRTVADRQAIADLIYRYCRAMDRIDAKLGYSVFHEDSVVDYDRFYSGTGRGFIDMVCEQHRHALIHSHQVTNIIIELDGDRAGSESYVTSVLRYMEDETLKQITVWARYVDQWSRRDGRWGIERRLAIRDFDEIRDVAAASPPGRGTRDWTDPSYTVLKQTS
jgi:hypothetical protein